MATEPIPTDVRRLIERHLTSVSEVEALVLLARRPGKWSVGAVAREFVVTSDHAARLLATLVRARLVRVEGDLYEFDPDRTQDREAAERLAELYDTYRYRVMQILFSKPNDEGVGAADG